MRALVLTLALAACTVEEQPIAWQSSLGMRTTGVGLHADGTKGHAGMARTNCPFETERGMVTGDYDLPGEGEEIQDLGTSWLGDETVVAVLPDTVWLLEKSTGDYVIDEVDLPSVGEVRLADDAIVALRHVGGDACEVVWVSEDATTATSPPVACAAGFTADPVTGTAFVAGADGVVRVSRNGGTTTLGTGGTLVAWDRETEALYVATRGEATLTALDADGTTRFTLATDGPVQGIAPSGAANAVALAVELDSGFGQLSFHDGHTGELRGTMQTPTPASDLTVSRSGAMVALEAPNEVHFYRLRF